MVFSESIRFDDGSVVESITGSLPTPADLETSELIDRLRAGDGAAFDSLVERYTPGLFALLFRLTGDRDEAADLVQDTFLKAVRSIRGFRGDARLKTWLYRIAINESRNRLRWWKRRRREVTFSLDAHVSDSDSSYADTIADISISPEESALKRERERAIENALSELSSGSREAIVLCDVEGLSYEETAEALGIPLGTVKSRIARGREELRKRLVDF